MPYIFGYGSLLNLKEHKNKIPNNLFYARLIPTPEFSVRRSWNARCKWNKRKYIDNLANNSSNELVNYTALGIEYVPFMDARIINGLIFEVTDEKLKEIIQREKGYDMVELPISSFNFINNNSNKNTSIISLDKQINPLINQNDKIIIFIPSNSLYPDSDYPLDKTYITMCLDGFLDFDELFAFEFIYTTVQWSNDLLTFAHKYIEIERKP
jgi:hypothetical protein